MLTKKQRKKFPEGFSDMLPEGICGITEFNTLFDLYEKPSLETEWVTVLEVPLLKRKEKIESVQEEVLLKPTSKVERPKDDDLRGSAMGMAIDYEKLRIPTELQHLELSNAVEVPEGLLEKIAEETEALTRSMGEMILLKIAPMILAYESSLNYVGAVMQDGFGIEFEDDPNMREGIKDMTKLTMFDYIVSKLAISEDRKAQIMTTLIDRQVEATVARMEIISKRAQIGTHVKQLEAIIASRSTGKSTVANQEKET